MKKIFIIVIVVALVLGVVYTIFFNDDASVKNEGLSSSKDNQKVGAELLTSLAVLDKLTLDTQFFSEQTFRRLVNFSKPIPEQTPGRNNPFASIGAGVSSGTTTPSAR
jgi:uncharacterized protein YxeA